MDVKEQLYKELLDIVTSSKEGVVKGISIANEQIPDVISQIIKLGLIEASVSLVLGFIFFVLMSYFIRQLWKKYDTQDFFVFSLLPMFLAFFSILFIIDSAFLVIKILVAPKVYLIEMIGGVLN